MHLPEPLHRAEHGAPVLPVPQARADAPPHDALQFQVIEREAAVALRYLSSGQWVAKHGLDETGIM